MNKEMSGLNKFSITGENFLFCVFVSKITGGSLVEEEYQKLLENKKDFLLIERTGSSDLPNIKNLIVISKKDYLYEVEALQVYYTKILNQIRPENSHIISSIIKAGVIPEANGIDLMIKYSFPDDKTKRISVGLIDIKSDDKLTSKVYKYENVHFNIYDMNLYASTGTVPVSSTFCTMNLDEELYKILKKYYTTEINPNESLDYHDFNLGLYLTNNGFEVKYYPIFPIASYRKKEINIFDYYKRWIDRYSGYYGNFFEILRTYKNCNPCNAMTKVFMTFQIIGLLIEFIYPALSSMVIYSIFYEAFGGLDYRVSAFFTLLYFFMLMASGASSLVSKDPSKMMFTTIILYFFMEVYYLLVIICSVPAMDKVRKNKNLDTYHFNTAAICCLIIFTFLPYIVPMILKNSAIIDNIVPMFMYLGLGAPSSTSNLLMAKLFNASDACGGGINQMQDRKLITLAVFGLFNLFFGSLTFYNTSRAKRVNCVMGLAIMFCIYNFFKILAIVLGILNTKDDTTEKKDIDKKIKKKLFHHEQRTDEGNDYGNEEEGESPYNENEREGERDEEGEEENGQVPPPANNEEKLDKSEEERSNRNNSGEIEDRNSREYEDKEDERKSEEE